MGNSAHSVYRAKALFGCGERPRYDPVKPRPSFFLLFLSPWVVRCFEQRSKRLLTTVDRSDIRGSSITARLHNRDPSGAASD